MTVWKITTNVEYRTLFALFDLGHSTVCTIVIETCHAIATHILNQYVKIPTSDKFKRAVEGFENFHRLQGLMLAHIYMYQ